MADSFSEQNKDMIGIWEYMMYSVLIILPLIILSLLNRCCFGKTVCIAEEKGLRYGEYFIEREGVTEAEYTPTTPLRFNFQFANVTLYTKGIKEVAYSLTILHFPVHGLRVMKKYAPHIKTGLSLNGIFIIAIPLMIALLVVFLAIFL